LDERATELYYQKLLSGRMPEKDGEIAVEKNVLTRLKIDAEVGDKITLWEQKANRDTFSDEITDRTYTLVGILKDRKTYLENCIIEEELEKSSLLPGAFVHSSQTVAVGGKEILIALYEVNNFYDNEKGGRSALFRMLEATGAIRISTEYTRYSSIGDESFIVKDQATAGIVLCFVLALMSCFAIVNSFAGNLKDRKKLIGMLRAIGATKRQIVSLFLKEAAIICAVCIPVSVTVSYFGVKLFAAVMGESFLFVPDWKVLIAGIGFSVLCVVLSALLPLIPLSRLSPMQAVRDIELMRKVKNKKIRSQNAFRVSGLLAKRTVAFSKAKFTGIIFILALTVTVVGMSLSLVTDVMEDRPEYNGDYEVYGQYSENPYSNLPATAFSVTEQKVRDCLTLPYVSKVSGKKSVIANLLIDGEIPEYLNLVDIDHNDSRYLSVFDNSPDIPEVTKENFYSVMQMKINPEYAKIKEKAGYRQEFIASVISAESSESLLKELESSVTDGKINIKKLNSGEEIIINAPEEIAYRYQKTSSRGYTSGLINLSVHGDLSASEKEDRKHIVKTAKNCFKAGDRVTLSVLCDDGTGKITRKDKTFTIGAVVNYRYAGPAEFFTTLEGLNTYGFDFEYEKIDISLSEECTAEIDEIMQNSLSAVFNGSYITSVFAVKAGEKAEIQMLMLSLFSVAAVFLCICITLINNSVTAQIRESKRTIGTLRAVGADEKELVRSYLLQILSAVGIGFLSGGVLYTAVYLIFTNTVYRYEGAVPFCLWAAVPVALVTLAACLINLKIRVRSVSKHSIVENIREL
ncbi:MAG: ABC transporter permease, partial [Acutalibacteraceae bacterium]